ncbi:MAG: hypothetical protein ACYCT2_06905 [Thermoplasmataceae archaeon]
MKDSKLKTVVELLTPMVESGRISISLEGKSVISAHFENNRISVSLVDTRTVRKIVKKIPRELKKISILREMSTILADQDKRLDVSDGRGLLIGMGTGKHNMFSNLDVKPIRLIKYL